MSRGARLIILGKQGAGKGTQSERLSRHFACQHLSTGQLFRDSAAVGVPAGLKAKEFMDRGELVPDEIVVEVVEERFSNPAEVENGFVLDGFPRTENQAEELDRILDEAIPLDLVIDLDVPTDLVIERLHGPGPRGRHRGLDPAAPGALRPGDEAAHRPLRRARLLVQVDGVGEEDEVFQRILDVDRARSASSTPSARARSEPARDHAQDQGPDRADAAGRAGRRRDARALLAGREARGRPPARSTRSHARCSPSAGRAPTSSTTTASRR